MTRLQYAERLIHFPCIEDGPGATASLADEVSARPEDGENDVQKIWPR